jgi:hypothetical protein
MEGKMMKKWDDDEKENDEVSRRQKKVGEQQIYLFHSFTHKCCVLLTKRIKKLLLFMNAVDIWLPERKGKKLWEVNKSRESKHLHTFNAISALKYVSLLKGNLTFAIFTQLTRYIN